MAETKKVVLLDHVLTLSADGNAFLRDSRYLLAFCEAFCTQHAIQPDFDLTPEGNDCTTLFESDLLAQIAHYVNPAVDVADSGAENLRSFVAFTEQQNIDDLTEAPDADSSLECKVLYCAGALRTLVQMFSRLPEVYADKAEPSPSEIKYVVDSLEDRALACKDINKEEGTEPSMFETGAWVVFASTFCGLIGIILTIVNLPGRIMYYKGDDGAAAITNALAIFNIVQLFASPLWHRVSERIGRKPSFVLISLNYAIAYTGFAYSTSYNWIFFFRGLSGLGAIYGPLGNTIVADVTPVSQRGKALA
ncbi:major facilitator superfamily protein, partial [Kipferlia bialata]|eukprot:g2053.t1